MKTNKETKSTISKTTALVLSRKATYLHNNDESLSKQLNQNLWSFSKHFKTYQQNQS